MVLCRLAAGVGSWVRTEILGQAPPRDYQEGKGADLALAAAGSAASGLYAFSDALTGGLPAVRDKLLHAGGSLAGTLALGAAGLPAGPSAAVSFLATTVGKELIWDGLLGRGTPDLKDGAANLSGALAGYVLLRLVWGPEPLGAAQASPT
jgi:hypothetical protein